MLDRLEAELGALRAFVLEQAGPVPARFRAGQRAALLTRAQALVEARVEPTPPSWLRCVEAPADFDDLLKSDLLPIAVRHMVAATSLSRERLYALRRWRVRVWGDSTPQRARVVARLELRGPPRGISGG